MGFPLQCVHKITIASVEKNLHSNMCSSAYQERVYEDEQGGGGTGAEGGRGLRLHDGVHQRGVRH
jgi:hypothetical protein